MAFEAEHVHLFYPGGPSLLLLPSPWLTVSATVSFAWVLHYYLSLICTLSQSHRKGQSRIGFFHFFLKAEQKGRKDIKWCLGHAMSWTNHAH